MGRGSRGSGGRVGICGRAGSGPPPDTCERWVLGASAPWTLAPSAMSHSSSVSPVPEASSQAPPLPSPKLLPTPPQEHRPTPFAKAEGPPGHTPNAHVTHFASALPSRRVPPRVATTKKSSLLHSDPLRT